MATYRKITGGIRRRTCTAAANIVLSATKLKNW
jgi:hypothetical protein